MKLLRSQKNAFFDAITHAGLSNSLFQFKEEYDPIDGIQSIVCYTEEEYAFTISPGRSVRYRLLYSPGGYTHQQRRSTDSWEDVHQRFIEWLDHLKKETATPDKWKRLSAGVPLQRSLDDVPFTPDERREVADRIALIKEGLTGIYLPQEHIAAIQDKLDLLLHQTEQLSKMNWMDLFLGAMISLIMQLSIPQEAAGMLWDLIRSVFSQYLIEG